MQKRKLGNLEVSDIGLGYMSIIFPAIYRRLWPAVHRTGK
jgi:aryl-alcohol dehydrogenase-like predicted oxidoreductase